MMLGTDPSYRRPPTPAELDGARQRGTALKRRRRAVQGLGSAGLIGAVLVATLSGGSTPDALQQLPAGGTRPSASPTPRASAPQPPVVVTSPTAVARPATTPSPAAHPAATATATGKSPWHMPVTRTAAGSSVGSICQYSATGGDPYNHGWCVDAVSFGEVTGPKLASLGVKLCRQTAGLASSGTLSFPTSQELEVLIRRKGKTVWTWSATQHVPRTAHSFTINQTECFSWSTTWNGTTSDGAPLAAGTYDVSATVVAPDQGNLNTTSTTTVRR